MLSTIISNHVCLVCISAMILIEFSLHSSPCGRWAVWWKPFLGASPHQVNLERSVYVSQFSVCSLRMTMSRLTLSQILVRASEGLANSSQQSAISHQARLPQALVIRKSHSKLQVKIASFFVAACMLKPKRSAQHREIRHVWSAMGKDLLAGTFIRSYCWTWRTGIQETRIICSLKRRILDYQLRWVRRMWNCR